jgi:hypothetical protein
MDKLPENMALDEDKIKEFKAKVKSYKTKGKVNDASQ